MIPEFTDKGLLPAGVHRATWSVFADRFVIFQQSDRRLRLGERLKGLYDESQRSGIVRRFLVAGSFVTDKAQPNDFDCLLVLDPAVTGRELLPTEYNLLSRRMARRIFKGDVIPAIERSAALDEYLDFFQMTRDGEPAGLVEIEL